MGPNEWLYLVTLYMKAQADLGPMTLSFALEYREIDDVKKSSNIGKSFV
jgi:hypothetical protein